MTATANPYAWKVAISNHVRQHRDQIHPSGYPAEWLAELLSTEDVLEVSRLSDHIIDKLEQEVEWAK